MLLDGIHCLSKEPSDRILTENDLEWINRLARAVPNPQEAAYALVISAKEAAIEYLEDAEIQKNVKVRAS